MQLYMQHRQGMQIDNDHCLNEESLFVLNMRKRDSTTFMSSTTAHGQVEPVAVQSYKDIESYLEPGVSFGPTNSTDQTSEISQVNNICYKCL